ncbi:MAG TPA: sulfite exporter TauE/SafE family protein [Ilumatobacteraceae bacterium]
MYTELEVSVSELTGLAHLAAGAAAVGAGVVNAVAGGGTLISFPVLTAIGVPAVRANATNTVALCPGYVGGTFAQRDDLDGLRHGLRAQTVAAVLGGLAGSVLLILSSEAVFRNIVPYLILAACVLLAVQDRVRSWLVKRGPATEHATLEVAAVAVASVYGGYFGAGLGIMLMAVLGLFSDLPFNRLNAVKQLLSFLVNVSAALFLVFSGKVVWTIVAVMAPASLVGGHLGGRMASSLPPKPMRIGVIVFGVIVAIAYLLK